MISHSHVQEPLVVVDGSDGARVAAEEEGSCWERSAIGFLYIHIRLSVHNVTCYGEA